MHLKYKQYNKSYFEKLLIINYTWAVQKLTTGNRVPYHWCISTHSMVQNTSSYTMGIVGTAEFSNLITWVIIISNTMRTQYVNLASQILGAIRFLSAKILLHLILMVQSKQMVSCELWAINSPHSSKMMTELCILVEQPTLMIKKEATHNISDI